MAQSHQPGGLVAEAGGDVEVLGAQELLQRRHALGQHAVCGGIRGDGAERARKHLGQQVLLQPLERQEWTLGKSVEE